MSGTSRNGRKIAIVAAIVTAALVGVGVGWSLGSGKKGAGRLSCEMVTTISSSLMSASMSMSISDSSIVVWRGES